MNDIPLSPSGLAEREPTGRDPAGGARRWATWSLAWAAGLASLALPLSWGGLWAPHELDVADLSRRIAVALHGASLHAPGADGSVPILSELGKGQLPFSSIALGFQLFGLSDWAGRLPLAVWAGLGLCATYQLVARFSDRIAGLYATLILATMPLYYVQARTMLGDAVTLAAVCLATTGLAMAVLGPAVESARARAGWVALALGGLAAGFASRGLWLGVACPALGIGLAWLIWRVAGQPGNGRFANGVGLGCLALGLAASGVGIWVVSTGSPELHLELMGARLDVPRKLPTHDGVLHQLGFGLFPWSAVAPFALALSLGRAELTQRSALVVSLGCVIAVSLALHGLGAPTAGTSPFVGTFAIAALLGLAFRRAEQSGARPRLLALGAAALLILLYADLRTSPEQALQAFSVPDAEFPDSFASPAKRWIKYGAAACIAALCLGLGELPAAPKRFFAAGGDARRWLGLLRRGLGGRLPWALVGVTFVLLVAYGALATLGVALGLVEPHGLWQRPLEFGILAIPALVLLPLAAWALRDLAAELLDRLPLPRARLALIGMTAFGFVMSLGYYPALASHLSPRNVFEAFAHRANNGEPLGVLGEAARVAPYYTGARVEVPRSPRDAFEWLTANPDEQRWLVLDAKHLAQLNHLYRKRSAEASNLPVVDAISSEVLLAASHLPEGVANRNPLEQWLSEAPALPQHPLDVDLEGKLLCRGWSITHADGTPVDHVRTGEKYQFRIYWQVTSAVGGTWKTFIHIDGQGRRFNGDHDTLEGKYPFRFWQQGDHVTDVFPFELESHYAATTYQVYFGLFAGNKRMQVTRGEHHDNRIKGGPLAVQ